MNSRNLDEVVTKSRVSRVRWVGGRVCSDCHDGVLVNKNTNAVMNSVCMCVSLVMNTYRRRGVRVSDVISKPAKCQCAPDVRHVGYVTFASCVALRDSTVSLQVSAADTRVCKCDQVLHS